MSTGVSFLWDRDGVNGGPSSIWVVLNWLSIPDNYVRWQGGFPEQSRASLCEEILEILHSIGIEHRCRSVIQVQIHRLIRLYHSAVEFLRHNPSGLAQALAFCPYWDELDPILGPFHQPAREAIVDIGTGATGESNTESTNST
ncbi:hypothetical protein Pst134EA_019714 [Puccinia striiformis f. sp. tritici]|uniref:hypothetical protein n=1 Tax=Puccinia striiformis f. sp. tritici TaxID=168172 RepID=UPI0020085F02|nr:hypothetical protein Pst134EA_019714 [Puccinia striiformis f. sp. tritici]KAH9459569.1 hypothetical protein Pst134EA_019714 [Puccinia striiformis f. sp. tritici]